MEGKAEPRHKAYVAARSEEPMLLFREDIGLQRGQVSIQAFLRPHDWL